MNVIIIRVPAHGRHVYPTPQHHVTVDGLTGPQFKLLGERYVLDPALDGKPPFPGWQPGGKGARNEVCRRLLPEGINRLSAVNIRPNVVVPDFPIGEPNIAWVPRPPGQGKVEIADGSVMPGCSGIQGHTKGPVRHVGQAHHGRCDPAGRLIPNLDTKGGVARRLPLRIHRDRGDGQKAAANEGGCSPSAAPSPPEIGDIVPGHVRHRPKFRQPSASNSEAETARAGLRNRAAR